MTHRDLEGRLADFVDERLSADETLTVEDHLETCADCRSWIADYRLLWRHRDVLHPESEALAERAAGLPVSDDVVEHLESCPECWALVRDTTAAIRRSEEAQRFGPSENVVAVSRRGLALIAAGLAATLLVASLLLVRLGAAGSDSGPTFAWAGPTATLVLGSVTRDAGDSATLRVEDGQPYVAVGLDLGRRLGDLAGPVRVALVATSGEEVWTASYGADALRARAIQDGLVMFHWPTDLLAPGDWGVRLEDSSGAPSWERRFTVVPREP